MNPVAGYRLRGTGFGCQLLRLRLTADRRAAGLIEDKIPSDSPLEKEWMGTGIQFEDVVGAVCNRD
jgi:hypothetical protein